MKEIPENLVQRLEEIYASWPVAGFVSSDHVFDLVRDALRIHPESAELHLMHGNLLAMTRDPNLVVVLDEYVTAILLNPKYASAYEDLGYFFDTYRDNFMAAELAFRRALECCPNSTASLVGLLRSMSQQGRKQEVANLIAEHPELSKDERVQKLINEIHAGEWDPI